MASKKKLPLEFHGFLNRTEVFNFYKISHFILLPSDSEGFPKVIAEAMNFGCIPIVSDISCIGQYVTLDKGYLIKPKQTEDLILRLNIIIKSDKEKLKAMATSCFQIAEKFTFDYYNNRIINEVLKVESETK